MPVDYRAGLRAWAEVNSSTEEKRGKELIGGPVSVSSCADFVPAIL